MFKKIELWILLLVVVFFLLFTFFFGVLVRQELEGTTKLGKISKSALWISKIPATIKFIFSKEYSDPQFIGKSNEKKIVIEKQLDTEHLYLLSRYSEQYQQTIIELRRLSNLELLHQYVANQDQILDLIKDNKNYDDLKINFGKRFQIGSPLIDRNGNVIAKTSHNLFKLDLCNNLKWLNNYTMVHHSMSSDIKGNYLSPITLDPLENKYKIFFNKTYIDDGIGIFSKEGELIEYKSISEILIENNFHGFLLGIDSNLNEDPIHLNDIEPALYDGPFFKKGDLFLSLRHRSAIIHYRPSNNKIVDLIVGPFSHQHDVDILDKNTISIFNNNNITTLSESKFKSEKNFKNNEILTYDLSTKKYTKLINNSIVENNISTPTGGLHEISDEYILIEEHDNGRIFLFNKNGEIYWIFNNIEEDKKSLVAWGHIVKNKNKINNIIESINKKKCTK